MLFYVNHTDATNYDVYAGVQVNANIQTLVSALPGALGQVLGDIISSDSTLQTNLNVSKTLACMYLHPQYDPACVNVLTASRHVQSICMAGWHMVVHGALDCTWQRVHASLMLFGCGCCTLVPAVAH